MESAHSKVSSYKDLVVWQKSVELVTEIYAATAKFPREGCLALVRSFADVRSRCQATLRKDRGRATKGEFIQFLAHARGSLFELKTQLLIAGQLGYLSSERQRCLGLQVEEVAKILNGLLTSLGVASRKLSTIN